MKVKCSTCSKEVEVDIIHDPNSGPELFAYCSRECEPESFYVGKIIFSDDLEKQKETDIYDEFGDIKY